MDNGAAENFESFDDAGEWEGSSEENSIDNDDWSKELPEDKEEVKDDLKVLDDSQADAEGKVIKDDKEKKEKKVEKKEEKEEEEIEEEEESEESEEKPEAKEETEEEKKSKSKLRMRMGNELFNVESDATFPVKIDGKVENVPVQELINNYSGKTAWDKKFTEIGKEKKAIEFEKSQITRQKQTLESFVNEALAPLSKEDGNPLDSLLFLVEKSGADPYNAYRRIMEANVSEINKLLDMSETERELYFHKKKDELYGKVAKQRQEKMSKEESFNQLTQKVEKLRQVYNVSEEEFVEAAEELEASFKEEGLDADSITEEQVVDYASLRPHIAKVKELVSPFEENIADSRYGDVVARLSQALRDGELDVKGISEILKRNFSVDEEVKDLNTKVYQKNQAKKPSKKVEIEETGNESFSDWE